MSATAAQVTPECVPISTETVSAAGFNTENPITSAVIGNIQGTIPNKKPVEKKVCEICNCVMSSDLVYSFHINGAKHKKKVKAMEILDSLKKGNPEGVKVAEDLFRCEPCSLIVNSVQQLELHIASAKHKNKVAKLSGQVTEDSKDTDGNPPPPKKKKSESTETFYCATCCTPLNSQLQYDQHMSSKKHKNKLNPKQPIARSNIGAKGFKQGKRPTLAQSFVRPQFTVGRYNANRNFNQNTNFDQNNFENRNMRNNFMQNTSGFNQVDIGFNRNQNFNNRQDMDDMDDLYGEPCQFGRESNFNMLQDTFGMNNQGFNKRNNMPNFNRSQNFNRNQDLNINRNIDFGEIDGDNSEQSFGQSNNYNRNQNFGPNKNQFNKNFRNQNFNKNQHGYNQNFSRSSNGFNNKPMAGF